MLWTAYGASTLTPYQRCWQRLAHLIRRNQARLASINTRTAHRARNYAIIVVLLDTGLRLGELCDLKLGDVHLAGKHCYLKVLAKGQKERIVYIGRRAHEALLMYQTFVRTPHDHSQAVQHFFLSTS